MANVAAEQLRSIVDRIENIDQERANLGEDRKEIFAEAKSLGYDLPALRALIKERKQDAAKRDELEAMVDVYRRALGQLSDTPLGEATLRRVA